MRFIFDVVDSRQSSDETLNYIYDGEGGEMG